MSKFLIAAWLLILLGFTGYAIGVKTKPPVKHVVKTLHIDSSRVQVRSLNSNAIQQYAKDRDFQYDDAKIAGESLWSRFWRWFWRLLSVRVVRGISLLYLILGIAFVAFLVFVVIKVAGIDIGHVFKGRVKQVNIPYSESLENIHEIDFDEEIEKAIGQRNFRLAVRLLYLRSLKQLSDAQLIHWQIEKTNSAYLNELTDSGQRQTFGLLTRQFEYVWYGDFFIDGPAFQNINGLFQDFKQMLR